ncbi:hypothetical protein EUX58_10880 [Pseudomonas sp. 770NI]|nr:hypothetical protein EUX58_10880 [Pseudomonas sp. 770NI]
MSHDEILMMVLLPVRARLLAKTVNDDAGSLIHHDRFEFFASKLPPTRGRDFSAGSLPPVPPNRPLPTGSVRH